MAKKKKDRKDDAPVPSYGQIRGEMTNAMTLGAAGVVRPGQVFCELHRLIMVLGARLEEDADADKLEVVLKTMAIVITAMTSKNRDQYARDLWEVLKAFAEEKFVEDGGRGPERLARPQEEAAEEH